MAATPSSPKAASPVSPTADGNAVTSPVPEEATVAAAAEAPEVASGGSKVRTMLSMMTKFIGVKDILNLRVSLPASLLDPVSNLEHWNYMDRPDVFSRMGEDDDPLDRMLSVIRWWFSKDVKFKDNHLAKPYNSVLGEQFLCHWDLDGKALSADVHPPSTAASVQGKSKEPGADSDGDRQEASSDESEIFAPSPGVSRVYCITEQVSHHPPVSGFYYYCPEKGIVARGLDHIAAKFTGTSVKVYPGIHNRGIFVTLEKRDNEEYGMTHPCAYVNGWLRGSLYITNGDCCIVTCPKTGYKAVIEYKEESTFGKAKFAIQGKIIRYDPHNEPAKPVPFSKIPESDVVCHLYGSWKTQIFYKKAGASSPDTLIDLENMTPVKKCLAPADKQASNESRQVWREVTKNIKAQQFQEATKFKREVEQRQRTLAKSRKDKGETFESFWFEGLAEGGTESDAWKTSKPVLRQDRQSSYPWIVDKQRPQQPKKQ